MPTLAEKVTLAAQALITAASFGQAILASDITSKAQVLHSDYADYSERQISEKIASEIKKSYSPGITGSI